MKIIVDEIADHVRRDPGPLTYLIWGRSDIGLHIPPLELRLGISLGSPVPRPQPSLPHPAVFWNAVERATMERDLFGTRERRMGS